jgi:PST family polysaccharide transporter
MRGPRPPIWRLPVRPANETISLGDNAHHVHEERCPPAMTLRQKVFHSLSWNFTSRIAGQFFQVAFSIVLARLLAPSEFGVIGMLLVFTGFAQALADGGLNSALIYRQDATEIHQSTVFWMQVAAGALLSLIFYGGASFIADFYGFPILKPLSQLLSCTFIIQALGQVHSALLVKEFRFKALAAATLGATAISGTGAILLAVWGYGVWALAWQGLIATCAMTVLLWLLSGWRPRLVFDLGAARDLGSYGIYLLGFSSLNYWQRNGANLLIGKAIGAHALGIFSRSYTLMLLPLNNVSAVFAQVMFPVLAQVQNDIPRFRQHYMTTTRLIALVTFPVMTGIAALAQPLTLFLLGAKWIEVVPLLQILSFVGMFQSIIHPVGSVYTALGKTKFQFHLSIILAIAFAAFMLPATHFGIMGISYAYAGWTLFSGYLNLRLVGRYIESSPWTILASVAPTAAMAGAMGVFVYALDTGPAHAWPLAARLGAGTGLGLGLQLALYILLRNAAFADFVRLVSGKPGFSAQPALKP